MEAFEGGSGKQEKPVVRHIVAHQTNVHPAKQKLHMPTTRNIKPSEIRNLANIIAEEEERQKMDNVKKGMFKKDRFKDLGVCQKPPSPPHGQVIRSLYHGNGLASFYGFLCYSSRSITILINLISSSGALQQSCLRSWSSVLASMSSWLDTRGG